MRGSIRSDLTDQLRRPSDLYRGHLAEDYDGVGQYVLVSMSRGSTAAALRARISSGDFGGGRSFPVGTPVVMHSHHGQLEVLSLGNFRCKSVFLDNFDRVVATGLGSTPDNYPWLVELGPLYVIPSVNGSEAVFNFTPVRQTTYTHFDVANGLPPCVKLNKFTMTMRFIQDVVTTDGTDDIIRIAWYDVSFFQRIYLSVNCSPLPDVQVNVTDGLEGTSSQVSIPLVRPNTWYLIKFAFSSGVYNRLKFWAEEEGEPAEWQINHQDQPHPIVDNNQTIDWERLDTVIPTVGINLQRRIDYIKFEPC